MTQHTYPGGTQRLFGGQSSVGRLVELLGVRISPYVAIEGTPLRQQFGPFVAQAMCRASAQVPHKSICNRTQLSTPTLNLKIYSFEQSKRS